MLFLAVSSLMLTQAEPANVAPPRSETLAEQIMRRIDEEMFYPRPLIGESGTGMVHVAFKLNESGMPYDVCIAKRTLDSSLNRAAAQTIQRIGPIHNAAAGKRYTAVLQYDVGYDDQRFQAELDSEVAKVEQEGADPQGCSS